MTDATPAPPARRPVVVTIAVVLVYLSGLASVAIGILVLLSRYQVDRASVLPVSLLGAAIILFAPAHDRRRIGTRPRQPARAPARRRSTSACEFVLHIVTIVSTDSWDWAAPAEIVGRRCSSLFALWAPPGSRHFIADAADSIEAASAARPAS